MRHGVNFTPFARDRHSLLAIPDRQPEYMPVENAR
jgi:hypothetical protein